MAISYVAVARALTVNVTVGTTAQRELIARVEPVKRSPARELSLCI